jgi:hypothetical protein
LDGHVCCNVLLLLGLVDVIRDRCMAFVGLRGRMAV